MLGILAAQNYLRNVFVSSSAGPASISGTGVVDARWREYIILRQHQNPSFEYHYLFTYQDMIHFKLALSVFLVRKQCD